VESPIGGRLKPRRNSLSLFFCPEIRWKKRYDGILPYRHRPARHLSITYPNDTATIWLVVASSHPAGAIEFRGPIALSIFIFFVALFVTQNDE
jgi:hypothetical protein